MVMPMVDIGLMWVRMFDCFMYVRMRVEAIIWNLPLWMVVCVMNVIMLVSMVVFNDCVNVLMRMFFA